MTAMHPAVRQFARCPYAVPVLLFLFAVISTGVVKPRSSDTDRRRRLVCVAEEQLHTASSSSRVDARPGSPESKLEAGRCSSAYVASGRDVLSLLNRSHIVSQVRLHATRCHIWSRSMIGGSDWRANQRTTSSDQSRATPETRARVGAGAELVTRPGQLRAPPSDRVATQSGLGWRLK